MYVIPIEGLLKFLKYAVIPAVLGFGLVSVNFASAHGIFGGLGMVSQLTPDQIADKQQNMFTSEAQVLGISVDKVKDAWAAGKTFNEIIQENNLDKTQIEARIKAAAQAQMKEQLQSLVTKGIITQAQADARLAFMQTKISSGKGHHFGRRFGRGEDIGL